jgi:nucleotide-binding universal stress UspA family protein
VLICGLQRRAWTKEKSVCRALQQWPHCERPIPRYKEIVRLSEELGVGTIVIGSRGLGAVKRALMGSVSESVVRHAHCPVFVVRVDGAR